LKERETTLKAKNKNEAELLLLAKHPDAFAPSSSPSGYWNGNPTSALTTALTSISHFINQSVQLSDTALRAWGEIGFLSHGFRFWRYDTVGGPNSLMAQFGFKPFAQDRPLDDVFGKGFIYENKPKNALIEFRRGYLLVSQKDHGTLIIRNSSTVFGRDLLRHPGYFMDKALSREEIETFDPRTLPDSRSILEKELYKGEGSPYMYGGGAHKPSVNDKHMWELVNTILEVKDQYRRFKFDTEAFTEAPDDVSEVLGTQPETPSKRFVGHLSPGFPKLVKLLNTLKEQNKPLPDLAFVHPEYPIYQPYTFGEDASGTPQNRYRLTPSHLKELNDFLNGTWSEKKYPDSTWIQFLNQAGVEKRAELVMLAPED
ncbi:MAG: hypothetical protein K2X66_08305, partial [Cyanobacteria bacterium]|nr:hypothetical protein [Cyanobacteriota bacterium]